MTSYFFGQTQKIASVAIAVHTAHWPQAAVDNYSSYGLRDLDVFTKFGQSVDGAKVTACDNPGLVVSIEIVPRVRLGSDGIGRKHCWMVF